ncbi:MAG: outer membrane protein transport protein [Nitrospinae bacterium]|nr:outer membrane protein transport protein [Nitrospinota bacterium]MBI3814837.1 outer membrane protein transport protein [Nitrospinota bacterium]
MKYFIKVIVCAIIFTVAGADVSFAGGVDENYNQSAEYVRTLNRNAGTDSADAAFYNPAGLIKLEDGIYINVSNQFIFKEYRHEVSGVEYKSDYPTMVFPDIYAVYKQNNWSAFASLTVPGGGGKVDYKDGSATTVGLRSTIASALSSAVGGSTITNSSMSLMSESMYLAGTFGGAYAVNDMVSLAVGLRYISVKNTTDGAASWRQGPLTIPVTADLEYEENAQGIGGIIGINISPGNDINIGLKYEMRTDLELTTSVKKQSVAVNGAKNAALSAALATDGKKKRNDLPAMMGTGVSYMITPELRGEVDFNYYFTTQANADDAKKDFKDSWESGLALEYTLMPQFKISAGFLYTVLGAKDANFGTSESPKLDSYSIAAGALYKAAPNLDINFGMLRTFYKEDTTSTNIKLNKSVFNIALGAQYKF